MTWYEHARWTEHASDTALTNIIDRADRDDRGTDVRIPWPLMLGILSRLADAEGRDGAASPEVGVLDEIDSMSPDDLRWELLGALWRLDREREAVEAIRERAETAEAMVARLESGAQ